MPNNTLQDVSPSKSKSEEERNVSDKFILCSSTVALKRTFILKR